MHAHVTPVFAAPHLLLQRRDAQLLAGQDGSLRPAAARLRRPLPLLLPSQSLWVPLDVDHNVKLDGLGLVVSLWGARCKGAGSKLNCRIASTGRALPARASGGGMVGALTCNA